MKKVRNNTWLTVPEDTQEAKTLGEHVTADRTMALIWRTCTATLRKSVTACLLPY